MLQFAEENLEFWQDVEDLQKVSGTPIHTCSPTHMSVVHTLCLSVQYVILIDDAVLTRAIHIYKRYIHSFHLNIPYVIKRELDEAFEEHMPRSTSLSTSGGKYNTKVSSATSLSSSTSS